MSARDELDACRVTLAMIRNDAKGDAAALDKTPFTGMGIGTQFGNTLAMIDALAGIVDTLTEAVADLSHSVEATP